MSKRKDKPKDKEDVADAAAAGICVARHPRSAGAVRRAKGWGGMLGLVLATYLSLSAHAPPLDAMIRGLAGGVAGYLVLWAIAVTVARQLVIAEVRARYAELSAAAAGAAGDAA